MQNWEKLKPYFSKEGDSWSEDPDLYAQEDLLTALYEYRKLLGVPVHPSPVTGALARFTGDFKVSIGSYHYVGGTRDGSLPIVRKSSAIDVFTGTNIRRAFTTALTSKLWGGIGVYFDTNFKGIPTAMLHLDLRKTSSTVIWFRQRHKYYQPYKSYDDMRRFYELLSQA